MDETMIHNHNYRILPWHLQDVMREYFENHVIAAPVEIVRRERDRFRGFLTALLEGDRQFALELADCVAAAGMTRIDRFLKDAPPASWGSPLNVKVWLELQKS